MGFQIVACTVEHEPRIRALNRRLREAGSPLSFPESRVPEWLPPGGHEALYNEHFVAVDDDGEVRGGYVLKHQEFLVRGQLRRIANYTLPLSEGVVDPRFGLVGLLLIQDAQRRLPHLFDLGIGGSEQASARLMQAAGWALAEVPFRFRVIRALPFLRNIAHLRKSAGRRLLCDALALSGAGWLGNKGVTLLRRRAPRSVGEIEAALVDDLGPPADESWQAARDAYALTAVRDGAVARALYPPGEARFLKLEVRRRGRLVGWAVALDTRMRSSKHFGDMRLGSIVDCFASPAEAPAVAWAADRLLAERGVDLVVSNQSHHAWLGALDRLGYLPGPSNFVFTASRALAELLEPISETLARAHLNRGDGDGPINL